ncbi:MAG: hypothetical protein HFI54_13960 [Lachnospiraceae bacterium]|jgi:hypothetical protein|nr:hypothetical protein [Lachnospiraceae bacterium]
MINAGKGVMMKASIEQQALIQQMDLMDDVFFQKVAEDGEVCEEILQVILQKLALKVVEAQTQRYLCNCGRISRNPRSDLPGWGWRTD